METTVTRRRFTVDEYHDMAKAGILTEDDRVELIDGEIIQHMPIGSEHQGCVDYLSGRLVVGVGEQAIVRTQGPVRLSPDSEPEPDVMLLRPRADFYRREHPTPADILLLIEVADTSLDFDIGTKRPLYAATSIAETWIVDLGGGRLLVYRDPGPDGYRDAVVLERGAVVAPLAFPNLRLAVADILG